MTILLLIVQGSGKGLLTEIPPRRQTVGKILAPKKTTRYNSGVGMTKAGRKVIAAPHGPMQELVPPTQQ